MTRVLVLSHIFPRPAQPSFGKFVEQRIAHVARHLPVEVVAPLPWFPGGHWIGRPHRSAVPRETMLEGIPVHHPTVPSIPGVGRSLDAIFFAVALLPFLRRLRRTFEFDVIDAHFGYPDGVAAALLGRWLGCPVLITLRGNELERARSALCRRQLEWAVRRARVIGVSDELAGLGRQLGAAAVRVIPNGVNVSLFSPGDRAAARDRLGLPPEATILLAPAAFVPRKRHDRLLQVVAHLHAAGRARILYVAVGATGGPQSCFDALRRQVKAMGLESQVRFAIDRPHAEMVHWLRAADVMCLASEREGSPNVVLEALACGLPVVALGVGEIPRVVRHGLDGFVLRDFAVESFAAAVDEAVGHAWDRTTIAAQAARRGWQEVALEVVEEIRAAIGPAAEG